MNRRNFIKIIGAGTGGVVLSSHLTGCDVALDNQAFGWNGPDKSIQDIRMQVLAYAMLCPNPHNIQPWMIRLTGSDSFNLYVDPERILPETDPIYRQIHIGQGTFLETLAIAASGLGYKAEMTYFPEGMYGNTELVDKPVAGIKLVSEAGIIKDPLFDFLLLRHSNKREYSDYRVVQSELDALHAAHQRHSEFSLTFVNSPQEKALLTQILTEAMQIEVGNRQRDLETIKMFRFNEDEIRTFRDGFGVAQTGLTGFKKIFVESFLLDRKTVEADTTEFGQQSVDMVRKVAESTNTFAWISSRGNTRLDQVKVGRDYCRMNLQTASMGLAQHPMSQVLQEYDDMLALQGEFKKHFGIPESETVQMLFRLGKAAPVEHGPRRLVAQIIKVI
ncbi:Acg family FMN-binding oxidoreductase [Marinomonas posidonica]|uniref:Acg family FMN-binding oxidoreductase n=1 Tax=Marinomonas posidonica TaxID=936476 RepID=UPI00373639F3